MSVIEKKQLLELSLDEIIASGIIQINNERENSENNSECGKFDRRRHKIYESESDDDLYIPNEKKKNITTNQMNNKKEIEKITNNSNTEHVKTTISNDHNTLDAINAQHSDNNNRKNHQKIKFRNNTTEDKTIDDVQNNSNQKLNRNYFNRNNTNGRFKRQNRNYVDKKHHIGNIQPWSKDYHFANRYNDSNYQNGIIFNNQSSMSKIWTTLPANYQAQNHIEYTNNNSNTLPSLMTHNLNNSLINSDMIYNNLTNNHFANLKNNTMPAFDASNMQNSSYSLQNGVTAINVSMNPTQYGQHTDVISNNDLSPNNNIVSNCRECYAKIYKQNCDMNLQYEIHEIQNKKLTLDGENSVKTTNGPGVNVQVTPDTTSISLNLRFK